MRNKDRCVNKALTGLKKESGSEIVQVVIVLGFALALGAALLLMQDTITAGISSVQQEVQTFFAG